MMNLRSRWLTRCRQATRAVGVRWAFGLGLASCLVACVVTPPPTFVSSEVLPIAPHAPLPVADAGKGAPTASATTSATVAQPSGSTYAAPAATHATDANPPPAFEASSAADTNASPPPAFQTNPSTSVPIQPNSVARRYGNLAQSSCVKRLPELKGTFKRVGAQKGVASPVRVVGEVDGVRFRVPGEKSKFGVLDCRLALTLVEFAKFLRHYDVAEVVVDNFYRPNAHLPGKRSKRSQHAYGLAIDLRSFRMLDGSVWDIEKDWGASVDTDACGPGAVLATPTEHTLGLRNLVCELFEAQLFSHHLTPSHDMAHRNHLHLDIQRDAKSVSVR